MIEEIINYCSQKAGAYEARPFGETPICYKVMGKVFAQIYPREEFYKITLKCSPKKAQEYRILYPGVVNRGYYCPPIQQPYWNTIELHEFNDFDKLCEMIDEAYEQVVLKLTKKDKTKLVKLSEFTFKDTDGEDAEFARLCDELDLALDELVGRKFQRKQYEQYNHRDSIHDVILACHEGEAVACGSLKFYDDEHAELKRIYVEPEHQSEGIGAELVRRLEAKAKIQGFHYCILETGAPLKAACHMYERLGYQVIPNYGQYADMPNSICMQRRL